MYSPRGLFRDVSDRSYHWRSPVYLYNSCKDSLEFVQRLNLETRLKAHSGCVNSICWNDTGQHILSGSDDQHLVITDPFAQKELVSIHSGHRANIFSAKFLPNTSDKQIVSCSGDGLIFFTELEADGGQNSHPFSCHFGTTYEVLTVPHDSHSFLSCGEDGSVRWFDLRIKTSCVKESCKDDILINCRRPVTSIALNPMLPYQLGVGCSDSSVRIFDRRMLGTRATGNFSSRSITGLITRFSAPALDGRFHRITSLNYSTDGEEVLVSYSSDQVYLFNLKQDSNKIRQLCKELECPPAPVDESTPKIEPTASTSADSDQANRGGAAAANSRQPPIKRLRLRGDWSDTGPSARPERERSDTARADAAASSIMQRMSDMLTRWLDTTSRQATGSGEQPSGAAQGENPEGGTANQEGGDGGGAEERAEEGAVGGETGGREEEGEGRGERGEGGETQQDNEDRTENRQERTASPSRDSVSPDQPVQPTSNSELSLSTEPETDPCSSNGAKVKDVLNARPKCDSESKKLSERPSEETEAGSSSKRKDSAKSGDSELVASSSQSRESVDESKTTTSQKEPQAETLTPVISLVYRGEGTSTSTISLGFEPPRETDPSDPLRNVAQESTRTGDVTDHVTTEAHTNGTQLRVRVNQGSSGSGSEHLPSADSSQSEASRENISQSENRDSSQSVTQDVGQTQKEAVDPDKSQSSQAKSMSDSAIADLSSLSVASGSAASQSESEMDVSLESQPTVVVTSTPSSPKAHKRCHMSSSGESEGATSKRGSESEMDVSGCDSDKDVKPETVGAPSAATETKSSKEDNEDAESAGSEKGESSGVQDSDQPSESTSTTQASSATAEISSSSSSTGGAGARDAPRRQRRIGHSGPPTGDFQLHSDSADDDDEDDSDTELMRAARRSRRSRWSPRDEPTLDRNLAAMRLQELYRKRQEEREKEELALKELPIPTTKMTYRGHRNARTMIKEAAFWGNNYIMSGSDCGHIFVWDRFTGKLVNLLEGDKHVVNCLQPHPYDPILATSGIDYDVKVWMPSSHDTSFDKPKADEIIRRNEIMLEETRDTITVPASFMLRMLASLNHFRAARNPTNQDNDTSSPSSEEEEDD